MGNFKGFLITLFFLYSSSLFAQPLSPFVLDLDQRFKYAHTLENQHHFIKARSYYLDMISYFFESLDDVSSEETKESISILVPVMYRLSIVTIKTTRFDMHTLYNQLEMFQETHDQISRLMIFLERYFETMPEPFPQDDILATMHVARGYNKLIWVSKLLQGISWKKYMVYPVDDLLSMLDLAMTDLGAVKSEFKIGLLSLEDKKTVQNVREFPSEVRLVSFSEDALLDSSLVRYVTFKDMVSELHQDKHFKQANTLRIEYELESSQEALVNAKDFLTYPEVVSQGNKPLFKLLERLTSKLYL